MKIKKVLTGYGAANTYIVYDENTLDGVMVDPSDRADILIKEANGINIKYILLTHPHFDHIGALEETSQHFNAPVVIHKEDALSLTDTRYNLCTFAGVKENKKEADLTVTEDDTLTVGNIKLSFIHTPGHTRGSMCIFVGDKDLFTGDTLFKGCIGRTDFDGGSSEEILKSLKKLLKLDDDIRIYPGHGEESTIGFEKMTNPYIYD